MNFGLSNSKLNTNMNILSGLNTTKNLTSKNKFSKYSELSFLNETQNSKENYKNILNSNNPSSTTNKSNMFKKDSTLSNQSGTSSNFFPTTRNSNNNKNEKTNLNTKLLMKVNSISEVAGNVISMEKAWLNNLNSYNIKTENTLKKANLDRVKISHKSFGEIEGYATMTTEGIIRDYNEDRVSIIFNISKPQNYSDNDWPKCSFFGLYDGHGGGVCADFLRDNLHKYVINII
jgi:hypothetical protein